MRSVKSGLGLFFFTLLSLGIFADSVDYVHVRTQTGAATASSVLKEPKMPYDFYQAGNAFDGKVETAWCEGKEDSGIGEWIEAKFKVRKAIGFVILNGYGKYKSKYRQNNRVRRAKVTMTLADGKIKVMELKLADNTCGWESAGGKLDSAAEACQEEPQIRNYDRESTEYKARLKACVEKMQNQCGLDEYDGGGERFFFKNRLHIKGIRLEILDIYKGEKFDDTCIAEIRFLETSGNIGKDDFKRDTNIKKRY